MTNSGVVNFVRKEENLGYNYYTWKAGLFSKIINLIDIAKYFDVSVDYLVGKLLHS